MPPSCEEQERAERPSVFPESLPQGRKGKLVDGLVNTLAKGYFPGFARICRRVRLSGYGCIESDDKGPYDLEVRNDDFGYLVVSSHIKCDILFPDRNGSGVDLAFPM